MAKAVHGNKKIDEAARIFAAEMRMWAKPDMQRNLSYDILVDFESGSFGLLSRVALTKAARLKQSPKARNQLSKPNTRA